MQRSRWIALVLAGLALFLFWIVRALGSGREADRADPSALASSAPADPRASTPTELQAPRIPSADPARDELEQRAPVPPVPAPAPPDMDSLLRQLEAGGFDGVVLDESGRPALAHIDCVGVDGGSMSSDTQGAGDTLGFFNVRRFSDRYNVKATTKDGRIAALQHLGPDEEGRLLVLELAPGGQVQVSLDGVHERVRCAIFQDDLRHSDFSLHQGEPHLEVVPAGSNRILLYEGSGEDVVVYLRSEIWVEPGAVQEIPLSVW